MQKSSLSLFSGLAAVLQASAWAGATDHTIEMFQGAFLPQAISVDLGDTVGLAKGISHRDERRSRWRSGRSG